MPPSFGAGLIALLVIASTLRPPGLYGQQPSAPSPFPPLFKGEVSHSELALKPAEKHQIEFVSAIPVWVGFKTDFSASDRAELVKAGLRGPYPKLTQENGLSSCGSLQGAATFFKPKDGKIVIVAENPTDRPVRLLIYTKPDKH